MNLVLTAQKFNYERWKLPSILIISIAHVYNPPYYQKLKPDPWGHIDVWRKWPPACDSINP